MASLPLYLDLPHTQTQWAALLNPLLSNPLLQGRAVNNIVLVSSSPQTINHGLGRNMIGWFLIDQQAAANVYRTQPFNSKTITLESSADCTINIWCF
jgi:hypothetical protein